jgi:magnesium transporter
MERINPLALDFLDKHPADCARILEQLPINTACSLIASIQPGLAAGIMECMVTSYGSECLHVLDTQTTLSIINEMKTPHAARLLRAMTFQNSKNILEIMPANLKSDIHSALRYPDQTVGRVMDSNPFSLPESISINDAVKRVKNLRERTIHEIFAVDDDHKLKGVIHVANLLSASRSSSLQTIITADVPYLSTRISLNSAAVHVGWQSFSALPVVGNDHILSGILKSSTLMHVLAETRSGGDSPDALKEMFSLTKMYWIVMTELINAVAGDIRKEGVR